jgi:hypothetical protein
MCNSTFEPLELALLPEPLSLPEVVGPADPLELPPDEHAAMVMSMVAAVTPANTRGLVLRKIVLLANREHSDRTVPLVGT